METVPAMLRHRMEADVLSEWHRDLGLPKHEFKHQVSRILLLNLDLEVLWIGSETVTLRRERMQMMITSAITFGHAGLSSMPKTEQEKRAAEMANTLDWLRSNDAADDIEDDMSLGIGSIATFKQIDAKSTGREGTQATNALEWLRGKNKNSTSNGEEVDDENAAFIGVVAKSKEEGRG